MAPLTTDAVVEFISARIADLYGVAAKCKGSRDRDRLVSKARAWTTILDHAVETRDVGWMRYLASYEREHPDFDPAWEFLGEAASTSSALVATGVVTHCCGLHLPAGCCDPNDCGPCCAECPTCPTLDQARGVVVAPVDGWYEVSG